MYQFLQQRDFFVEEARKNKIFLYPTDTLYGIGGLVNHKNIERIRAIKKRNPNKKLSIIAPSFQWIFNNFRVENPALLLEAYNKYHGVTYILSPKDRTSPYAIYETKFDNDTIGVRIIKHPFQEFVAYLWEPFFSTSANLSGENNPKTLEQIDSEIIDQVDYIINEHEVFGKPSTLINITSEQIIERQ